VAGAAIALLQPPHRRFDLLKRRHGYRYITASMVTTAGTVWMNRIFRLAVAAP
jgi:hypothetical protein